MSLINQMLQELEQRKASSDAPSVLTQMAHPVHAVAVPRKNRVLQYAVLGALCIGGVYGVQLLSQRMLSTHATLDLPSNAGMITEANANMMPPVAAAPVPTSAEITEDVVEATVSFTPSLEKTLHLSQQSGALAAAQSNQVTQATALSKTVVAANAHGASVLDVAAPAVQPSTVQSEVVQPAARAQVAIANTMPLPKQTTPNAIESKSVVNKSMTAEQKSAHAYQQAISYLQQGRVAEAQDQLVSALELYPQHEDARQTLVGLLVDNKRLDQAMQVLKSGLQLTSNQAPNHGSYAQTLARLQLDAGLVEDALHTLETHSAYVQQPDAYYALMAVVLQKTGQHAQAITRYQQALSRGATTPAWLIGMAVSLQAEGRAAEAKQAYQQAQASQLSPELALFVSQRLKQVQ
ncbi:tetratricopeptide repeat protein [Methylotenera sp. N17]|uniref:tetratricopeptide repeat protein n=1 Tax=Methylotenera sp. N17 TaxID=1502761 RepID=UPI000648B36D|nr:tetratricopeptide repeat protein [Methylotenera sp. N17]